MTGMCMKIDLLRHMPCKTFCNYHFGFRFGVDVFLLRDVIYATTSLINTEFEYSQVGLILCMQNAWVANINYSNDASSYYDLNYNYKSV